MKLAVATLLVGSAAAFSPAATFGVRNSALHMAEAETVTETKVRTSKQEARRRIPAHDTPQLCCHYNTDAPRSFIS
jgi:hypothetical protein